MMHFISAVMMDRKHTSVRIELTLRVMLTSTITDSRLISKMVSVDTDLVGASGYLRRVKATHLMQNPLNTVIIWQHVPSSAVSELRLRPRRRTITVEWRSGHYSTHAVRRRDMLRLLDPRQSVGQWVNSFALS